MDGNTDVGNTGRATGMAKQMQEIQIFLIVIAIAKIVFYKLAKIRRFLSQVHFAKIHFRKYSLEIEVSKLLLLVIAFGKDITSRGLRTLCNGRTDIPIIHI